VIEQDSADLTAVIRMKIADGLLPLTRPSQLWAGDGKDNTYGGLSGWWSRP